MNKWTVEELKLALVLYCQLPFGKMHSRNQYIIRLIEKIGRTPSAVAMKLVNLASLDQEIVNSGRSGLGNASAMDRHVWEQFQNNWDGEINVCCMSGLSEPRLLVASHIMSWNRSNENRLNPKNGLCLSVLHDKAYDRGLLTVRPDYSTAVSSEISKLRDDKFIQDTLIPCHGKQITMPEKFHPEPHFLTWHNENIFKP